MTRDDAKLEHLPITLFGSVMGLAGLSIAWLRFEEIRGLKWGVGEVLIHLSALWFLALLVLYAAKVLRHAGAVRAELRHPVRLNFFPAVSISLILLGIGFLHLRPDLARALWWFGASLHLLITLRVLGLWIRGTFHLHTLNPAWFIPVVGTILVPVAGAELAHPDISWFFFSIGMVFWLVFLAMVFYRLVFHDPLPEKLLPTLSILIAPPSVGFIAWVKLTGGLDPVARVLYSFGLFSFLLVLGKVRRFIRLPYFVSWWAYTFPLASVTLSTLLMSRMTGAAFYAWLGAGLLGLTSLVVLLVLGQSLAAVRRGEICVAED